MPRFEGSCGAQKTPTVRDRWGGGCGDGVQDGLRRLASSVRSRLFVRRLFPCFYLIHEDGSFLLGNHLGDAHVQDCVQIEFNRCAVGLFAIGK